MLDPRNSRILHAWVFLLAVVFWFDILSTPIFILWPQYLPTFYVEIWICDVVWLINMLINFITIRLDTESRDPLEIALKYIQRLFFIDFIATLPSILTNHNVHVTYCRILHVFTLQTVLLPLDLILKKLFSNSRHKRITYKFFLDYAAHLILISHYCVCIWLSIGDKYLMDDYHDPW